MRLTETNIAGVYIIDIERISDDRGFFARSFDVATLAEHGLHTDYPQCNISFNAKRGTLRGMHYQADPHGEVKIVRCTMGRLYDVALDMRPESVTYKQWVGVELSAENHRMLYLPTGIAHGFQTLEDATEVFYMMGTVYHPQSARGVRWNDSAFSIQWRDIEPRIMSDKDRAYEDFTA
ncbi:MAG: dTDP-4-dehydrorhamnose 3,5-epimerase [Chloroflexota bacterium]